MSDTDSKPLSWAESFAVYTKPKVLTMLFLGFAAGLPFLLVFSTLTAWLTEEGLKKSTIGFFSWVGITYSIKVFWAPVVDRLQVPLINQLGQRRSWMLLAQTGIVLGLLGMAFTSPTSNLEYLAYFAVMVAFSSATQDVVIDAYRIEAAAKNLQGAMSATYILGYRIALLTAGAGAFYIAEYGSWVIAYLSMAALGLVGIITTLVIPEPDHTQTRQAYEQEHRITQFLDNNQHLSEFTRKLGAWFIGAVLCPFIDFIQRNKEFAIVLLALIGLYRMSDITMGVMANPFYLDLGFSKPVIANVSKVFGFLMSIAGAGLGGVLVVRYGIKRPLLAGAILVAMTNLLFVVLAKTGTSTVWLSIVISADNLSGGLAGAAFIAYLSSLTNSAYTATQYALFSSLMTLPAKFIGGFSGIIVEAYGYEYFFTYSAMLGIPAIILVLITMRHDHKAQQAHTIEPENKL